MELGFLNTCNKPICEYHIDSSTTAQDMDSYKIGYIDNKVETYWNMNISVNDDTKYSGEEEIDKTLDSLKETITSEDLDNQITQQSEDAQDYGGSEYEEQDME